MATAGIFEYTLWYHPISMALVFKARKESPNPVLQPLKPFCDGWFSCKRTEERR